MQAVDMRSVRVTSMATEWTYRLNVLF